MLVTKLRDILRYVLTTIMSNRAIGRFTGISYNIVRRIRIIALEQALTWPAVQAMDDAELEAIFKVARTPWKSKIQPDLLYVRNELQRPGMTLRLLWEEYREAGGNYSETQHNHIIRKYLDSLDLTMRQVHVAGEWTFADYCGKKIEWTDPDTGKKHEASVYVGVLGCSNYSFAYATPTQSTADTADATVHMWDFFGGTSLYYCTDNMKSVVITPGPEPVLNREFSDLARHYQVVVIPTRVRHPQDKGKVEVGVQVVQRWIIMRLRRRHFNSVAEINIAVMELLTWLNQRPFRHLPGCRRSRFEEYDQPVLRPLPAVPYEYGEWEGEQKVGPDYHPRVRGHYYSVHYSLVAERVEARVSAKSVEIFHRGKRIASHLRSDVVGGQTTNPEHRPIAHRAYAERTPEKFLEWAKSLGPATSAAVEYQLQSRDNSPLALRACGTLQRLAKEYGAQRLEAACQRGQEIRSLTLKSISSILRRKLDAVPTELPEQISLPLHGNVRGPHYFT